MRIDLLTLFPAMCEAVLGESILGRARAKGLVDVRTHNIRDYTLDRHGRVDDYPYGGGRGMVMGPQPIFDCFSALCDEAGGRPHLIYLSPCGTTFTQQKARELAARPHIALLCGHYEGIDQRVLDCIVDEEISVGDFVVTGGELPALLVTDAVCRMVDGVLPEQSCYEEESHYGALLEYPQYTRPPVWREREVPAVLLSGDHAKIAAWRRLEAMRRTRARRPDLYARFSLSPEEEKTLRRYCRREGLPWPEEEESER